MPKISLFLKKDNKVVHLYPSHRKMSFFLKHQAGTYFKNGYKITIRVKYGYHIDCFNKKVMVYNSGTYSSVEDLNWAFLAFVKDYLSE